MYATQIEQNVKELVKSIESTDYDQSSFIYELLLAYGHRKQSVTRLRSGERNLAKSDTDVIWRRNLFFRRKDGESLLAEIDQIRKDPIIERYKLRFIIVTNFNQLLAVDTKTSDSLDISLYDLPKHFDFFLPWAGMEKAVYQGENPADVKAAEKMAKLFDLIKADNFNEETKNDKDALHNLNIFLTRLLFCYFAEDTEIFTENQFSRSIKSHTNEDGSDLSEYLNRLFVVLNTDEKSRNKLPEYLSNFPYVNGCLFTNNIKSPLFFAKSRKMLIECGNELDWSDINPDIFGSMFQAVVHPDQRGGMGMHYTSVTNIMKVIEPLFLNDLYDEFEKHNDKSNKLHQLLQRLGEIKIFDPACGSGNFLIIAYKELRKLEMDILKQIQNLEFEKTGQMSQAFSVIKLSQYYGIEIDDFAHEIAILSLWLAEHQANIEFKAEFGEVIPLLPLKKGGQISVNNALLIDWSEICETNESNQVFVLGNPPYLGDKVQSDEQKRELKEVFKGVKNSKAVDYITGWFLKAARYIKGSDQFSFVTTNSICQGIQVSLLWPHIFEKDLEIGFAHTNFVWSNSAKNNAAVICSIIGLRSVSDKVKYLFESDIKRKVHNINAYLIDGPNIIVKKHAFSIAGLPKILTGNIPRDKGYLMLSTEEKEELVFNHPKSKEFVKQIMGSKEFINSITRWCLWITDEQKEIAESIISIKDRLEKIIDYRMHGSERGKLGVNTPHKFERTITCKKTQIIIPRVSSQRREYIPIGYLNKNVIISDAAQVIYDADTFIFSVISSKIHMAWIKVTAGRLKSDYRYSSGVCYNSFPMPTLTNNQKTEMTKLAMNIISTRESFPDKSPADLYDPEKMPMELQIAHQNNDSYVDRIFRKSGFEYDHERLECLFSRYNKITGDQND